MRKLLTIFFIYLLSSYSIVHAQHRSWSDDGVEQLITEYGEQLELTDAQKEELISKQIERRNELRGRTNQIDRQRGNMHKRSGDLNSRQGIKRQREAGNSRGEQQNERERGNRQIDRSAIIYEVLNEDQIEKLHQIRIKEIELQFEVKLLQNKMRVEKSDIDESKAEQVLSILNSQTEYRKQAQIERISGSGRQNRETIRELHAEMMNLLTAAEYQNFQHAMHPGYSRRAMMNRRGH